MNNKYIGIVLIVIGVALLAWGYNVYDSVGSHINRTFSGDAPIEAWISMVAGAVCIATGIIRVK